MLFSEQGGVVGLGLAPWILAFGGLHPGSPILTYGGFPSLGVLSLDSSFLGSILGSPYLGKSKYQFR